MLERNGAKTALVMTEGFRDIYEIGRINRPDAYNLYFQKHEPLVERALRFEVKERVLCRRRGHTPLDEAEVAAFGRQAGGARHRGGRDPVSELLSQRRARSARQGDPGARTIRRCSSRPRTNCRRNIASSSAARRSWPTPMSARACGDTSARSRSTSAATGFRGLVPDRAVDRRPLRSRAGARRQCIRMLESGPAAGVIGTQALCHALGLENAIAFDMGGTTAKAGVIYKGEALTTGAALIGGYDRALPVQIADDRHFRGRHRRRLDRAGGGGRRAACRPAKRRRRSRARPATAAAAREPTVTDANLVLGRLGADRFLGGEMRLDVAAAETRDAHKVAKPLGMTRREAADGILRIAATAMSYAVKGVTTERGLDAGDFRARRLWRRRAAARGRGGARDRHPQGDRPARARHVLGLRHAVLGSALRFRAHLVHAARRRAVRRRSKRVYRELETRAARRSPQPRSRRTKITVKRALDMRYVGQEHAVTVDLPLERVRASRTARRSSAPSMPMHAQRYGTSAPDEPAEIVEPAHHRHRRDAKAAAGEDQARHEPRRRQAAFTGKRAGLFRRQVRATTPTYRARRACSPATGSRARR